ncbi:hypothetical protein BH09ACT11_BH09ACT11_22160 [soil metagenome]
MTTLGVGVNVESDCLARLEEDLDALQGCAPDRVAPTDKSRVIQRIAGIEARLAAWKLQLLATATDAARVEGHRDPAAWFATHTNTDTGPARSAHKTAQALGKAPAVAAALAAGALSERHAKVILDSLHALPPVAPVLRQRAEEALVRHAQSMTPTTLAHTGTGILEEVDPTGDHHHLEETLAGQAADAWANTTITIRDRGNGTTDVAAVLPTSAATRLRTYLEALTSPRRHARVSDSDPVDGPGTGLARVPHATRLGRAFATLIEHIDPAGLPAHGRTATTLIITMDHHDLVTDLGAAGLLDAHTTRISGAEARRLACNAQIIPAVLGTTSEVLDLGRTARLFTPAQVKALRLNQHTCQAEGCDIPTTWCEAHHLRPWSHGGRTDLKDAALLCSHHHHLIHDPRYHHEPTSSGRIKLRLRR